MEFLISRCSLYQALQKVISIIKSRPRLPILRHVLLEINDQNLFITSTDLEIEITVQVLLDKKYVRESITIPGHKFFEICHNLPENLEIFIELKNNKFFINSSSGNFCLSTLPASNFPKIKKQEDESNIIIPQSILKKMIKLIQFSMGYKDVRPYLNGMYFETKEYVIRMIATDGYRLSMCEATLDVILPSKSVIVPRKGVLEWLHLLDVEKEKLVNIQIYNDSIYMNVSNCVFRSNLINSEFPDYRKILLEKPKFFFEIDRIILKQALRRASILSNEKLRIVNLHLTINQLKISTNNFEQESSEETLEIVYLYPNIEISFNVDYLLDIINMIGSHIIKFFLIDAISRVQIEGVPKYYGSIYIVMPIKR